MDVIRVIVADDHPSMCEGIRNLLQAEADMEVVGAVTTGQEALQQAVREEPDVLLLDMEMPDLSGLEVARQLEARGEARWFVDPSASPKGESEGPLTEREEEILALVASGHSNEEVAEQLHISTSTVRNHLSRVYEKLGTHSQRQAIAWAWRQGLAE